MNYAELIKTSSVDRGEPCNFIVMTGGRYQIPKVFLKSYVSNLLTGSYDDGGIIFKVSKSRLYPLIIDIDLDLSQELKFKSVEKTYHELATLILGEFQEF